MSRIQVWVKKWLSLGITFLLVLSVVGLAKNLIGFSTIKNRFMEAQQQVDVLETEKKQFEAQLQPEDQAFIEEEQLRNGLGLAREGETVVIIPKEVLEKNLQELQTGKTKAEEKANWQKWVALFL
ncbi:hypothetical protein A3B57_03485 [Microgenomates group bacterium RIFCSPLOWO2_01_FULL_47_10]|nr:MAG: hypothetical protein A3B57_03485 [Microgenomates group bacterium RIFCSPLOWO2_01_FULL_47_10]